MVTTYDLDKAFIMSSHSEFDSDFEAEVIGMQMEIGSDYEDSLCGEAEAVQVDAQEQIVFQDETDGCFPSKPSMDLKIDCINCADVAMDGASLQKYQQKVEEKKVLQEKKKQCNITLEEIKKEIARINKESKAIIAARKKEEAYKIAQMDIQPDTAMEAACADVLQETPETDGNMWTRMTKVCTTAITYKEQCRPQWAKLTSPLKPQRLSGKKKLINATKDFMKTVYTNFPKMKRFQPTPIKNYAARWQGAINILAKYGHEGTGVVDVTIVRKQLFIIQDGLLSLQVDPLEPKPVAQGDSFIAEGLVTIQLDPEEPEIEVPLHSPALHGLLSLHVRPVESSPVAQCDSAELGAPRIRQFQNYTFADLRPTIETEVAVAGANVFDTPTNNTLAEQEWTLVDILSRPQICVYNEWSTSSPRFRILGSLTCPVSTGLHAPVLEMFNFAKYDVEFMLKLNASRFHQGMLMVVFVPAGITLEDTHQASWCTQPHVLLDVSTSNSVTLRIPWTQIYECRGPRDKDDGFFGSIQVVVWNTLRTGTSGISAINYTMWTRFINPKMHYPRQLQKASAEAQADGTPTSSTLGAAALAVGGAALGSYYGGVVEGVQNAASELGQSTVQYVRDTVTSIASGSTTSEQKQATNDSHVNKSSVQNMDKKVGIVLGAGDATISTKQDVYHDLFDSFVAITGLYSRVAMSEWNAAQPFGRPLFSSDIAKAMSETPFGIINRYFLQKRGSWKVKIQCVATDMHQGRLAVSVNYGVDRGTKGQFDCNVIIVDLQEKKEIEFEIPYLDQLEWKTMTQDPTSVIQTYLSIDVMNPLRGPSNVSDTIDVNIYIATGPDWEFAIPIAPPHVVELASILEADKKYGPERSFIIPKPQEQMDRVSDLRNFSNFASKTTYYSPLAPATGSHDVVNGAKHLFSRKIPIVDWRVEPKVEFAKLTNRTITFMLPVNPVIPFFHSSRELTNDQFSVFTEVNPCPFMPYASMFQFWQGSITYDVRFGTSNAVSGLAHVGFLPAAYFAPHAIKDTAMSMDMSSNHVYTMVNDFKSTHPYLECFAQQTIPIGKDENCVVTCPQSTVYSKLCVSYPWHLTDNHNDDAVLETTSGFLFISIPSAMLEEKVPIGVKVFMSMGPDFKLSLFRGVPRFNWAVRGNILPYKESIQRATRKDKKTTTAIAQMDDEPAKPEAQVFLFDTLYSMWKESRQAVVDTVKLPREVRRATMEITEAARELRQDFNSVSGRLFETATKVGSVAGRLDGSISRTEIRAKQALRNVSSSTQIMAGTLANMDALTSFSSLAIKGTIIMVNLKKLFSRNSTMLDRMENVAYILLAAGHADTIVRTITDAFRNWLVSPERPTGTRSTPEAQLLEEFSTSSLATVVALFGGLVSAILLGKIPDFSSFKEFATTMTKNLSSIGTMGRGIDWIEKTFLRSRETLQKLVDYILGRENLQVQLANALAEHKQEFLEWVTFLDTYSTDLGREKISQNLEVRTQVYHAMDKLHYFQSLLEHKEVPNHLVVAFSAAQKTCKELYNLAQKASAAVDWRIDPFCLCLYGAPNVGKTTIAKSIAKRLMEHQGDPQTNQIYVASEQDKYMSGYTGQTCFMIDEFGGIKESELIKEFNLLKGNLPHALNMADISEKNRQFESKYLILTTNVPYPEPNELLVKKSLWRRRDALIEVDWRKVNGLRMSRTPGSMAHLRFRFLDPVNVGNMGPWLDSAAFIQQLELKVDDYFANQTALNEIGGTMLFGDEMEAAGPANRVEGAAESEVSGAEESVSEDDVPITLPSSGESDREGRSPTVFQEEYPASPTTMYLQEAEQVAREVVEGVLEAQQIRREAQAEGAVAQADGESEWEDEDEYVDVNASYQRIYGDRHGNVTRRTETQTFPDGNGRFRQRARRDHISFRTGSNPQRYDQALVYTQTTTREYNGPTDVEGVPVGDVVTETSFIPLSEYFRDALPTARHWIIDAEFIECLNKILPRNNTGRYSVTASTLRSTRRSLHSHIYATLPRRTYNTRETEPNVDVEGGPNVPDDTVDNDDTLAAIDPDESCSEPEREEHEYDGYARAPDDHASHGNGGFAYAEARSARRRGQRSEVQLMERDMTRFGIFEGMRRHGAPPGQVVDQMMLFIQRADRETLQALQSGRLTVSHDNTEVSINGIPLSEAETSALFRGHAPDRVRIPVAVATRDEEDESFAQRMWGQACKIWKFVYGKYLISFVLSGTQMFVVRTCLDTLGSGAASTALVATRAWGAFLMGWLFDGRPLYHNLDHSIDEIILKSQDWIQNHPFILGGLSMLGAVASLYAVSKMLTREEKPEKKKERPHVTLDSTQVEVSGVPINLDVIETQIGVSGDPKTRHVKHSVPTGSPKNVVCHVPGVQGCEEGPVAQMGDANTSELIQSKIKNNVLFMQGPYGKMHALAVGGQFVMMNRHFTNELRDDDEVTIHYPMRAPYVHRWLKERVFSFKDVDVAIVWLGTHAPICKSLFKNFVSDKELPYVMNCLGSLVWWRDGMCQVASAPVDFYDCMVDTMPWDKLRLKATYKLPTVKGMCGAPLVIHNPRVAGKIVGIHYAGTVEQGIGHAAHVTRDMIDTLLALVYEKFPESRIGGKGMAEPQGMELRDSEPAAIELDPSLKVIAVVPKGKRVQQPVRTEVIPSKIHKCVVAPTTGPSVLHMRDRRMEVEADPLAKAVNKYAKPIHPITPRLLVELVTEMKEEVKAIPATRPKQLLTMKENVLGNEMSEYIRPLTKDTSPGLPYRLMMKPHERGKQWMFNEDGVIIEPELATRFEERELMAKTGNRVESIWFDCLKDERRPIAKIKEGKTRAFTVAPCDFTLLVRKYCMDFVAACMNHHCEFFCAPGINPQSIEWTMLYDRLSKNSNQAIAGDFSNFDGTMHPELIMAVCELINTWYDDGEVNARVRRVLFHEMCYTDQQSRNVVYETTQGNPSGNPLTVIINSFVNVMYMRLAYKIAARLAGKSEMSSLECYHRYVAEVAYGDDNVLTVHEDVGSFFNQLTVTKHLKDWFGIVYTDESKGEAQQPFKNLDECTFLKQGFGEDPRLVGVKRPLMSKDTIGELTNWIRRSPDDGEATRENCLDALQFAFYHGSGYYMPLLDKINRALIKRRLEPLKVSYECFERQWYEKF